MPVQAPGGQAPALAEGPALAAGALVAAGDHMQRSVEVGWALQLVYSVQLLRIGTWFLYLAWSEKVCTLSVFHRQVRLPLPDPKVIPPLPAI